MHVAKKQFIAYESSEKLRCAFCHQVRTNIIQSYINGDVVLYKRNLCNGWLGSGTVTRREHKQVFVKHGDTYIIHTSHFVSYPVIYQSSSEDSKIELTPHQKDLIKFQKYQFLKILIMINI